MLRGKKDADEFVDCVQRISQVGRSCLVHILLATQRPDRETVRGAIKANLNCRVVFRLPTQADSITVLGTAGAEKLLFYGDMLFKNGPTSSLRLQGYKFYLLLKKEFQLYPLQSYLAPVYLASFYERTAKGRINLLRG
jgi:DNA segregation ATPase FtsK/SpoIIIE-like protein